MVDDVNEPSSFVHGDWTGVIEAGSFRSVGTKAGNEFDGCFGGSHSAW